MERGTMSGSAPQSHSGKNQGWHHVSLPAQWGMESVKAALVPWLERWPAGPRYLVGVSGGLDSVVLLHSLQQAGYRRLVVCHLDHGLRGRTAAADARWVGRLSEKLGWPCIMERRDVRKEAAAAGVSLETAGRAARHRFFAEVARQHRCPRLFLAHHADDQAETVLMNLCRGAAGLSGMAAENSLAVPGFRTPLTLLRPFLTVSKTDLREAAAANRWAFREDASNAVPDVVRNRLRLEVLPLLDAIFQRPAAPAIGRAAAWAGSARDYLAQAAAPWICQDKLRTTELAALPPILRDTVLAGWLRAQGVPDLSSGLIRKAGEMLDPATGPARWNVPGNGFLRRRAGWLWVERVPACGTEAG